MSEAVVIALLDKNAREKLRVSLVEYQGRQLLDVRVLTQLSSAADVWSPTKKGVSVQIAQLPALASALVDAEAKARRLGLIGGES